MLGNRLVMVTSCAVFCELFDKTFLLFIDVVGRHSNVGLGSQICPSFFTVPLDKLLKTPYSSATAIVCAQMKYA